MGKAGKIAKRPATVPPMDDVANQVVVCMYVCMHVKGFVVDYLNKH